MSLSMRSISMRSIKHTLNKNLLTAGVALVAIAIVLPMAGTPMAWTSTARAQNLTNPVYREAKQPAQQQLAQQQAAAPAQQPVQQSVQPVVPNSPVQQAFATQPVATTQAASQTYNINPASGMTYDGQVVPASAVGVASPLDLTQQPGEHPLMPFARNMSMCQQRIQGVQDYAATFTKVERIDGKLGDTQQMQIRVRHNPFSIYMNFVQPNPGQEVLYVANQNNGKLVALGSGWKRRMGKMNLDPNGSMAMQNQRYPITRAGILNLITKLSTIAEADMKYAESTVSHNAAVKIDGRPVTMVELAHPVPRKNFTYHKTRVFIDHELLIPVAYEKYSWPAEVGGRPVLEERYIYTNLKVNNGFSDLDFSPDNPAMFQ